MLRQLLTPTPHDRGDTAPATEQANPPAAIRLVGAPGDGPALCRALCARQAALAPRAAALNPGALLSSAVHRDSAPVTTKKETVQ